MHAFRIKCDICVKMLVFRIKEHNKNSNIHRVNPLLIYRHSSKLLRNFLRYQETELITFALKSSQIAPTLVNLISAAGGKYYEGLLKSLTL